jgi:hypothetical protein
MMMTMVVMTIAGIISGQGLPRSTVELLNADGWDVLHASQCGLSTAAIT